MNIATLSCTSCGAPIQVSDETDHINCKYCSSALVVKREAGQVSLKLAEKVSQSIQETGLQTQSTIREGTYATQAELKKLQLSQELSSVDMQLANLRAEIRALERLKADWKIKREIKELKGQERDLAGRQNDLRNLLAASAVVAAGAIATKSPVSPTTSKPAKGSTKIVSPKVFKPKKWSTAFVLAWLLGIFGIHRFYTGYALVGIIQLFTFGGLLIWWIIDLFKIASGKFKDAHGLLVEAPDARNPRNIALGASTFWAAFMIGLLVIQDPTISAVLGIIVGVIVFLVAHFRKPALSENITGQ